MVRVKAPDKAIAGFLSANRPQPLDQAELRETGKGTFCSRSDRACRDSRPSTCCPAADRSRDPRLPWPKSMRWGRGTTRWVRPLHGIVALFGDAVVPGALDLGAVSLPSGVRPRATGFPARRGIAG